MESKHKKQLCEPKLYFRLVAKAIELLNDKFWGDGAVPDGVTPEDIVQNTIIGVLIGTSIWDTEKYPDPYPVLVGMVRSRVANLVRCARNRRSCPMPSFDEESHSRSDESQDSHSRLLKIKEAVSHDTQMLSYVKAAMILEKRSAIAEYLGITPTEVTNLQKRVQRFFNGRAEEFGIYIDVHKETK